MTIDELAQLLELPPGVRLRGLVAQFLSDGAFEVTLQTDLYTKDTYQVGPITATGRGPSQWEAESNAIGDYRHKRYWNHLGSSGAESFGEKAKYQIHLMLLAVRARRPGLAMAYLENAVRHLSGAKECLGAVIKTQPEDAA